MGEVHITKLGKVAAPFEMKRLAVIVVLLSACAQSHWVRPLGKGNGVVSASLGGPFVHLFGVDIPAPIVSLNGGYGVRDDLDVFARLDVTGAAFGDMHLEPGVVLHPVISEGGAIPTVSIATSLHILTNFKEGRAIPQVSAALAWRLWKRLLVYFGGDLGLAFGPVATFRALGGPFLGGEVKVGRVGLSLELKWIAPQYESNWAAPAWVGIGGYGYLSLLIGINVYLGKVK
jgi:hypothetical protein